MFAIISLVKDFTLMRRLDRHMRLLLDNKVLLYVYEMLCDPALPHMFFLSRCHYLHGDRSLLDPGLFWISRADTACYSLPTDRIGHCQASH